MIDLTISEHTIKLCGTDRAALAQLVAETGESENMAIQTAIVNAASMNTSARRKASANYHAKRTLAGLRKVTLWLSPEAREILDRQKDEVGSKDAAADEAIRAHYAQPRDAKP